MSRHSMKGACKVPGSVTLNEVALMSQIKMRVGGTLGIPEWARLPKNADLSAQTLCTIKNVRSRATSI